MTARGLILAGFVAAISCVGANAQQKIESVKVGVLTDMAGPFADQAGEGSVVAARLAAEDYTSAGGKLRVEIVSADHQNKPDVGVSIARKWVDVENVAAIVDLPNSGVALAVSSLMKEKNRVTLASISASSTLTGSACSPNTVQWMSDTWAQANTTVKTVMRQTPGPWFFITVDYALGIALETDATAALKRAGGTVAGSVRVPLSNPDFASALLTAQASNAKVIALANSGTDAVNTVKQIEEFGLTKTMQPAALFMIFSDVHALDPKSRKGLVVAAGFYWDLNEKTRAFSKRFAEKMKGRMPTEGHAAAYSATLHYLRSLDRDPTLDGARVVAAMKSTPIDDPLFGTTEIRPDGRAIHPMYLFKVKGGDESRDGNDLYSLIDTIPASDAFRPLTEGGCPLVK